MSGTEVLAVLGVISSIIGIIDGIKKVCDAASDVNGLPEAFREVAVRLPIVMNILISAKQCIDAKNVDEYSLEITGLKGVVDACEEKARKLQELFTKVMPSEDASRVKRYFSAVKHLTQGRKVETLMKGILEDVQLLDSDHGMKTVTTVQLDEVAKAIMAETVNVAALNVHTEDLGESSAAVHALGRH